MNLATIEITPKEKAKTKDPIKTVMRRLSSTARKSLTESEKALQSQKNLGGATSVFAENTSISVFMKGILAIPPEPAAGVKSLKNRIATWTLEFEEEAAEPAQRNHVVGNPRNFR